MKRFILPLALMFALVGACSPRSVRMIDRITNTAVAFHGPSQTVYGFGGLGAGKSWYDVTAKAFACKLDEKRCESLPPLPDGVGRLAATAQIIGDTVYIFGGYSVAEDSTEVSTPQVWAFDVKTKTYARKADMPMPVDDSVSLVYQNRYIYLVSGWHKDDNVVNVQMYDTKTDAWFPATDWPGEPVFGQAGGVVGNVMVICDGVHILPPTTPGGRRRFKTINACYRGEIDAQNPGKIHWRKLPPHPGPGLYRMAATGWAEENMVLFAGGTDNAYNYNGIGYDGRASQPSAKVWGYDVKNDTYVHFKDLPRPRMDHRALLQIAPDRFALVGGMDKHQNVVDTIRVIRIRPKAR